MHLDWSISKYVGMQGWSAGLFLLVLIAAAVAFWNWPTRNKVTRALLRITLVLAVMVGLFPYGLFNPVITMIHQIVARLMFVMMFVYNLSENRGATRWIYMAYGIFCGVSSVVLPGLFWSYDLIWEILYLGGFLVIVVALGRGYRERLALGEVRR